MSKDSHKLRLGPLPRTQSIKIVVTVSSGLKECLDDYADAHSRAHGETVDAGTLIPHILHAFITRDRGFRALRSLKAGQALSSNADQPPHNRTTQLGAESVKLENDGDEKEHLQRTADP